jgi:hypothetical protein
MFTQITYKTNLIKQILCCQVTRVYISYNFQALRTLIT